MYKKRCNEKVVTSARWWNRKSHTLLLPRRHKLPNNTPTNSLYEKSRNQLRGS